MPVIVHNSNAGAQVHMRQCYGNLSADYMLHCSGLQVLQLDSLLDWTSQNSMNYYVASDLGQLQCMLLLVCQPPYCNLMQGSTRNCMYQMHGEAFSWGKNQKPDACIDRCIHARMHEQMNGQMSEQKNRRMIEQRH